MGRRLLLILGMILLASPAIPAVRGQSDGQGPPGPETGSLGPPSSPLDIPSDIPSGDDSPESGEKAKPEPTQTAPHARIRKPDPALDAHRRDGAEREPAG